MAPLVRDDGDSKTPTDPPEEGNGAVPAPRESKAKRRRDPMIGRTIAGRFRIRSVIARGGMGKVYRAEQLPLGRDCAVKVLNPKYDEGDDDPEFRRRFFLEASTASKLTHANTVTIFDYGEDDGVFYIAMEYVAGRTLFRVLREDGPLEEVRVAGIIAEVARSLREAHGIGVIHRDMKPANIVLSESESEGDSVKVLDFGLVKHVEPDQSEDLTQQGLFMGSPKYMAPEQILGNAVSPATDLYALGVVAYELLTGKVPFNRGSSVKTLMAHVNDAPPPLYVANPDVAVSAEMTAIVMRCIEKDPKHRYGTVDELLRDLSRVAGGGPMVESLLRIRKASVPPEAIVGEPEEDTAPTMSGRSERPSVADPEDSAPVSSEPFVGQWPSATPEPMSQTTLDEPRLRPASRRKVVGVLGLVAAVALGVVALATGDAPKGDAATEGEPDDAGSLAVNDAPVEEVEGSAAEAVEVPAFRVVRITSAPTGAQVSSGDEVVCGATPCEISFQGTEAEESHSLTFRKEGYVDATVTLGADAETLEGKLVRPAKATSGSRGAKPAIEPKPAKPKPEPGKSLSGYKDSPY